MDAAASVPVIDASPLVGGAGDARDTAAAIGEACRKHGFFYVVGHGVSQELQARLEALSRGFFAQNLDTKMRIRMELGGGAWRGYFPVGGELTSGEPDIKEGLYFGAELGEDDPRVRAGVPMHGANLFPEIPGFREAVLGYMAVLRELGHALMRGVALSLGLAPSYFADRYMRDPLILFRIFHYPPVPPSDAERWGMGKHTDYACSRSSGGRGRRPPGQIQLRLDRRSPPARILRLQHRRHARSQGTYGSYLLGKVAKVFPQLRRSVIS